VSAISAGATGVPALDPSRVEVLLCDADGNLFPSEEPAFVASADVTNRCLAELGVDRRYTPTELRLATTGKNFRTTIADLAVAHGAGPLAPAQVEHWVREEQRIVTAYLRRELEPDAGVREPLARLAPRFALAAVSSSAAARLEACFEATGLDGLVPSARRFSAEDSLPSPRSKPDPAIYRFALARLGIGPEQALAIEDSVPGAASSVAAGIATIGNVAFVPVEERADRTEALVRAGVAVVVSSWTEIEELLA
jgi:beta-phosphoglucomutase-like phosphatase (HAD superfamily)